MITTETILNTTVHGTPSGNYDGSSMDWTSLAVKAANYYRGRGSVQTVLFSVNGFSGTMVVEATLDEDPTDTASWFTIYTYNAGSISPATDYHPEAILGNFTWIRVKVENFSSGTINLVTISY